jgi:hypothetical protein
MVIAALVCFTILLIAWVLAPDHPNAVTPLATASPEVEPAPLLEAA